MNFLRTLWSSLWNKFIAYPLWGRIIIIVALIAIPVIISIIAAQNPASGYIFANAKKMTIKEVVSDSGNIISDGKVVVNSPTNGIITDLMVENGQKVKEDDPLFTVKSSATVQEQQTAYATYQQTVAAQNAAETLLHSYRSSMYTYWKAYTDLATNSTYESSKGVPNLENRKNAEFQTAQSNWYAAEKQFIDQEQAVGAAQAAVNAAWTAYQATQTTTATAPVGGIVENITVSVGKSVQVPSILAMNAAPVMTIINSASVEAVLNIGQTDIAKVKPGQQVIIYPDPYKDLTYDGIVTRVDRLGANIQGVITYNVYITFKSADEILRDGMTLDGDIITNIQENVLAVPNSAIVVYQGKKAVRILKDDVLTYIPVTIGIKGESYTQITSGIRDGQQVISSLTNERAAAPGFLGL